MAEVSLSINSGLMMRTKSTWLTQVFIGAIIVPTALHQIHLGSSSSNERTANSVIRGISVQQHWLPITFKWENKHLLNQNIRLDAFTIIYLKSLFLHLWIKSQNYLKQKWRLLCTVRVFLYVSVRDLLQKIFHVLVLKCHITGCLRFVRCS